MYAYPIVCILHIVQKNTSKPPTPRARPPFTPADLLLFFIQLLPRRTLLKLPALQKLTFYERLFTPLVTLWYLLFQWLNHDHSLDAVVTDVRAGGADRLNRKLSRQIRSCSTGPYSDARSRLPADFLAQALRLQGSHITAQSSTALWQKMIVALLDGTTVRLRSLGDIPQNFPPHGNQHQKKTYWCLMRVAVTFCSFTGAALDCALGSTSLSEQALACELILRAVSNTLFIGDRNFGVFRIVQVARHAHKQVLLRMTDSRAAKLLGGALRSGDFALTWKPTGRDRLEPDCSTDPLEGRLIVVRLDRPGFRSEWLCLFTTLTDRAQYPAPELVQLYNRRWYIELDLRHVKAQMGAGQLEVHSAMMARKQWLACLLAYNLVRAAMFCAALQQDIPPLTLSFSACRRRLQSWLRHCGHAKVQMLVDWDKLLREIARCRLPKRKQPRPSEPRAKRHVRESFPPLVGSRARARKNLKNAYSKS
jgi:hypothetical protein